MSLLKKIIYSFQLLLLTSIINASDNIDLKSLIIFNTACANCHEGECSGRMTFHLPPNAINQHIERHAGSLTSNTIQNLSKLLAHTKQECSFYPFPEQLVLNNKWQKEKLLKYQSPIKKSYFIPLAKLNKNTYQLQISGLNSATNTCIEIINSEFEFIEYETINDPISGLKKLDFKVDDNLTHFLRIKSHKKINIDWIKLLLKHKT